MSRSGIVCFCTVGTLLAVARAEDADLAKSLQLTVSAPRTTLLTLEPLELTIAVTNPTARRVDGVLAFKGRALSPRIFVERPGGEPERVLDPSVRMEQSEASPIDPDSMFGSLGPGESVHAEVLVLVDWATRRRLLPEEGRCSVWVTVIVPEREAYCLLFDPRVSKERIEREALDPGEELDVGVWGPDYFGAIKKRALLKSNTLTITVSKPSGGAEAKALSLIQSCEMPHMLYWPDLVYAIKERREDVTKVKQLYLMKEKTPYHPYALTALAQWKTLEKLFRERGNTYKGLHNLGLADLEIEGLSRETTEPRLARRVSWLHVLLQMIGIAAIVVLTSFLVWRRIKTRHRASSHSSSSS